MVLEDWHQHEWEPFPGQQRGFGRVQTLRNRRTGALADEYQLSWATKGEYEYYLKSFYWRHIRHNLTPVVAALHLVPVGQGAFCSERLAASVYLEHVSLRLCDIEEIPLADGLYVILEGLEGYQHLYQHAGYFRVEEDQVGLDRTGRVKVWVNGDYGRNYPETDSHYGAQRKSEVHMVQQFVEMVFASIDREEHPPHSLM